MTHKLIFVSTWQIPTIPITTTRSQATRAFRHTSSEDTTLAHVLECHAQLPTWTAPRGPDLPEHQLQTGTAGQTHQETLPGNTHTVEWFHDRVPGSGMKYWGPHRPQYSQLRLHNSSHREQTTQDDILTGTNLLGRLRSHVGEQTSFSGVNPEK